MYPKRKLSVIRKFESEMQVLPSPCAKTSLNISAGHEPSSEKEANEIADYFINKTKPCKDWQAKVKKTD